MTSPKTDNDNARLFRAYKMYRVGFWIVVAIVLFCIVLAHVVLITYDVSLQNVLFRVIGMSEPDAIEHYAWLPDHYYDNVMLPLPHSYRDIKTVEEFQAWKHMPGGVLSKFENRLTVSNISDTQITSEYTRERPGYTLTKMNMPSVFDSEPVIFYEMIPSRSDVKDVMYDTVLVIPGSGHQGALDVLGEDGPWISYYYQSEIARTLVQAGYVVYTVELRGYGERAIDVGTACNRSNPTTCSSIAVENKMSSLGLDMGAIRTDEVTQVLAYAESRPYTRNIAVAGLSLGAGLTANQAIINHDVVDAVVMASGLGSVLFSPLNMNSGKTSDLTQCCDTTDLLVTIAPMPAYVSYGLQESTIFRWEAETGYTSEMFAHAYALHNKSENFWSIVHDGTHGYDVESVLDFLQKTFNNVEV